VAQRQQRQPADLEVADNAVRVHLLFDNTSGSAVKLNTALGGQGIQSYIQDKKEQYPATGAGGALFADPNMVAIAAGAQKQGWLEHNTGGVKLGSLNLYLESTTGSSTISYRPIKLKLGK
jgi:hypothetical protein